MYFTQPLTLYHGTCSDFQVFKPLSHFGTKRAAEAILNKSKSIVKYDSFVEQKYDSLYHLMHPAMPQGQPKIIPVLLDIKHPLILPDLWMHSIKEYSQMAFHFLMCEQLNGMSVLRKSMQDAQQNHIEPQEAFCCLCQSARFLPIYRFIFSHPFQCPYHAVEQELALGKLYQPATQAENRVEAEKITRHYLVAQRMIRFWEGQGYDGICYENQNEDKGSMSFIIFRPEQVARLDAGYVGFKGCPQKNSDELVLDKIREEVMATMTVEPLTDDEMTMLYLFELNIDSLMPSCVVKKRVATQEKPMLNGVENYQKEMCSG